MFTHVNPSFTIYKSGGGGGGGGEAKLYRYVFMMLALLKSMFRFFQLQRALLNLAFYRASLQNQRILWTYSYDQRKFSSDCKSTHSNLGFRCFILYNACY